MLLRGWPQELEEAIKEAEEVEYVLQFSNPSVTEVNAIQQPAADKHLDQLTQTMEKMALQLKKLEAKLQEEKPLTTVTSGRGSLIAETSEHVAFVSIVGKRGISARTVL